MVLMFLAGVVVGVAGLCGVVLILSALVPRLEDREAAQSFECKVRQPHVVRRED